MSTGTHTLIQRQDALTALRNLHRVCAAMDLENDCERPTEDEYQAAMADAEAVIGSAA